MFRPVRLEIPDECLGFPWVHHGMDSRIVDFGSVGFDDMLTLLAQLDVALGVPRVNRRSPKIAIGPVQDVVGCIVPELVIVLDVGSPSAKVAMSGIGRPHLMLSGVGIQVSSIVRVAEGRWR